MDASTTPTQTASVALEADDSIDDEAYAESTTSSYVTSIASSIRRGIEENGRTYPAYGKHLPAVPCDEDELDRNDLQHSKINLILSGRLHLAPIGQSPEKILDLGTGSGIWAIDMADKYASASVVGVDIAVVQPQWVPPNLEFEIEDVENDWLWTTNRWDFIHGRELMFAIRDWPKLIRQSLEHLRPGGYMEIAGTVPLIGCDDGTFPENTAYAQLSKIYFEIGDAMGATAMAPTHWKRQMEEIGFEDVRENIFKIPTNPWPKDKRLKNIGAFELIHFRDTIVGLFLRGYTQLLKGDLNHFQVLMAQARTEVQNRNMHTYVL